MLGEPGDAYAQIERKLFLPPQSENLLPDALSRFDDALSIGDEENYDELISPSSEDEVDIPGRVLYGLAGRLQDLVTELVATRIVDLLEIVQIAKEEGEATFLASRSRDFLFDAFVEVSSVVQVGEGIPYREVREGLLRELAFGDVPEDSYPAGSISCFVSERREVGLEEYRLISATERITALFGDRGVSGESLL